MPYSGIIEVIDTYIHTYTHTYSYSDEARVLFTYPSYPVSIFFI